MRLEPDIGLYWDTMIAEGLYTNKGNLQFKMAILFAGIDFKNLRVLDIGGGSGLHSFYAACSGAREVVCLEPEGEGSCSGVNEKFARLKTLLQLDNVVLKSETLQDFKLDGGKFDIVLLHNSINHLDETACINLLKANSFRAIYEGLFSKINSLSNRGAKLIVCDCSRYNFFPLFRVHNPIDPSIEWHKHHSPEVWASLLGDAGFVNPEVEWSSFNRLRRWGKFLFGNRLIAYFLTSHFCLTMEKS